MGLFTNIRGLFGKPIPSVPDRETSSTRIVDSLRDRQSLDNVLANLTPQRLRSILSDANEGWIGRQVELAQTIEECDTHVRSVLQTRRLAAAGLEYVVSPGDESEEARQAADEFREIWRALQAYCPVRSLLKAVLPQWAAMRIVWDTDGKWTPIALEDVDCRRLVWPFSDGQAVNTAIPALSIDWTPTNVEPLTSGKYIVHGVDVVRGRPGRMAMVRSVMFWWMVKRFTAIDWSSLIEQHGRPWKAVKYDPASSNEQVRQILQTLKEAAADLSIALPKTSELQLLQAMGGSGQAPHEGLCRFADQQISKAIVGAATIADAASNNESVSSPTHAAVAEAIRNADAQDVAATIVRDLVVPWCLWNYGPAVSAPKFEPQLEEDEAPAARSKVYLDAANLGMKVKSDQLYRELAIEKPEGVEDVIELKAQSSGFGVPGSGGFQVRDLLSAGGMGAQG